MTNELGEVGAPDLVDAIEELLVAHVVGGEREVPLAEARVEIAKVMRGRLRREARVLALVDEVVLTEAVDRAGHQA